MNDSASGGYVTPESAAPADDEALDKLLQQAVAGITGLAGSLVRPRWQTSMPNMPPADTTWCAVGFLERRPDTFAYARHVSAGQGSDIVQRQVEMDALASFYGPRGGEYAALLCDGLSVGQNRDMIRSGGLVFVSQGAITPAPVLTNNQWIRRYDLPLVFRRQSNRTYPIRNILSAGGTISADDPPVTTTWNVEQ